MNDPPKVTHYKAAVADFVGGTFIIKTTSNENLLITLGPSQVISAQRAFDKAALEYEERNAEPGAKFAGVWR